MHAQEILRYGNSSGSVLIKMQPLFSFLLKLHSISGTISFSFWRLVCMGLLDCNQYCQDFLKFPDGSAAFCKH